MEDAGMGHSKGNGLKKTTTRDERPETADVGDDCGELRDSWKF